MYIYVYIYEKKTFLEKKLPYRYFPFDNNIIINPFFFRVIFINDNEILKAHRQLEANQAPQMGLFCTS